MQIRAYAIHESGGTAEPFEYDTTLGSRDVLVRITHRSLARGDIQFIDNAWGDTRLIERLRGTFADSSDPRQHTEYQASFDFTISTLNVPFDLDSVVEMLTPAGQLRLVASPVERFALSGGQLNNSRRSIYGNYVRSRSETVQMLEFAATHRIEAVVDVMPFARVNEAIERIRKGDVEIGLVLET